MDDATGEMNVKADMVKTLLHFGRKVEAAVFLRFQGRANARGKLCRAGHIVCSSLHGVQRDRDVEHEVHDDHDDHKGAEQQEVFAYKARKPAAPPSPAPTLDLFSH